MKVHPDLFSYVKRIKENPLEEIKDFPSLTPLEEKDFKDAIDLCQRYAHGRNKRLTELFIRNRKDFLNGERVAPCCESVKDIKFQLQCELHKYHNYQKGDEIRKEIEKVFSKERYSSTYKLISLIEPFLRPISFKNALDKSLELVETVDLNEIEKLIEEVNSEKEEN